MCMEVGYTYVILHFGITFRIRQVVGQLYVCCFSSLETNGRPKNECFARASRRCVKINWRIKAIQKTSIPQMRDYRCWGQGNVDIIDSIRWIQDIVARQLVNVNARR